MSMPGDDHESRIRILEQQIETLRDQIARTSTDAAAARVLAGGADRDVSDMRAELRAHTQTLNALRETQFEHGQAIGELRAEMRAGFATMNTGMARIVTLLEGTASPEPE